jgi:hypothetical protein
VPEQAEAWAAARACYGAALCVAPAALLRLAGAPGGGAAAYPAGDPAGPWARDVLRVLGTRHLAQAAVSARWPTPRILAGSAAADLAHAASMIGLAALDPRRRRVAIIDVLIETTFAAAGIAAARRGTR